MLKKNPDRKITMLTCYDYPTARALDNSDIDIVFVGDSVGTNMLGYRSELEVTLDDMVHHLKAVRKGVTSKVLVVDLPYATYDTETDALKNARLLHNKGADIIKMEGGANISGIVKTVVDAGIPVMGHIGFQPQIARTAERSVVGALSDDAVRLHDDAIALQKAGACAVVLECVPEMVAKEISERLRIPTIGIGSGKFTDGQVLVYADVVGWYNLPYRFIKRYDSFFERTVAAANRFAQDVITENYPQRNHGFRIKREQLDAFLETVNSR
ncbi:MAG: 3-methyl-2-oxobutanoate hydroxymethyltransferase [Chitinivibrionales bacterium]|nr:3-methyl-2-oxobutanoate hydroxymethyltransferase [Chitinivibrionales bacterium]